jgi:hypothetical protein
MKKQSKIKLSFKKGGQSVGRSPLNNYVKFFVIGVWIVVGGLTGSMFVNALSADQALESTTQNQNTTGVISQTSQNSDGVEWEITAVSTNKGSEPFIAPTGEKFVVVDLKISNNSPYTFNFAPVLQTKLASGDQLYEMWPTILENPIVAGPIESGKSISGQLSYLVPDKLNSADFVFALFENQSPQTSRLNF